MTAQELFDHMMKGTKFLLNVTGIDFWGEDHATDVFKIRYITRDNEISLISDDKTHQELIGANCQQIKEFDPQNIFKLGCYADGAQGYKSQVQKIKEMAEDLGKTFVDEICDDGEILEWIEDEATEFLNEHPYCPENHSFVWYNGDYILASNDEELN